MRVLKLVGQREFRWEEKDTCTPGLGEVRLRVRSVGICGSDIHVYAHGRIGETVLKSPLILGHEFSATINELGPGVKGLSLRQLVAVDPSVPCERCEFCLQGNPNFCQSLRFLGSWPHDGALSEFLCYPAHLVHPVPEEIFTSSDAAMIEPLGVALHSLKLGHVHPGDSVAVHGCGPIGLLLIQLVRNAGAIEIIAIEPIPHRRQMALELGATHSLSVDDHQVEGVLEITKGRGVDRVFEAAGENEAVGDAIEVCKPGGRVVLIGIPVGDVTSFRASPARHKGLTIMLVRRMRHTYPRAISLVEAGKVDVRRMVTHHLPFEQTPDAFRIVENREDDVVKAVIHMSE